MNSEQIAAAAEALLEAERTRVQCGLISAANPGMSMEDAYAVQAAFVAVKCAEGRDRIGWKIGLTSEAMQAALGIDIPEVKAAEMQTVGDVLAYVKEHA